MVQDMIPADAPFAPEQRRFVEGFMAGLISVRAAHAAAKPVDDAAGTPITLAYGSQSGNCEALSKDLRKLARASGFKPDVVELAALDAESLQGISHLLIVCSTFGEGDPPDNAKAFCDLIQSNNAPDLSELNFGVCALGDRSYTHFCKTGTDIDRRLSELGGKRLIDCVQCDVAYEDDWAEWKEKVFATPELVEIAGEASGVIEDDNASAGPAAWTKANPFPATLLKVKCLNQEGSAKEVNHIEISLAGSGMDYEVGDALGVWPVNCGGHVDDILKQCQMHGEEVVQIKGEVWPLRAALLRKLDLCTMTQKTLDTLGLDTSIEELGGRHLIDVLLKFNPEVNAQQLVDALRPLQPRLYSIASSPKAHPGQVQLTVGAVRYDIEGRSRNGVASTFLADRLHVGASVGVYLQKAAHFHLPEDPATPIIMTGPGTGIAPFRAFLEEREAVNASGDTWLFFGDQHEATDYLYREQLQEMITRGSLTRLSLAWSRDGNEKIYVQNRMVQEGAELWHWLKAGSHFYVCGDASRMAGDVDRALRQVVAEHGQMSEDEASAFVDAMIREGRYQRDVY